MKASVIIPTLGGGYLDHTLRTLGRQTVKPDEVVLVVKGSDPAKLERKCSEYGLSSTVLEQTGGRVTRAYNMGKEAATGDVLIFTDDDVLLPPEWVERHLSLHRAYPKVAGIGSRDIQYDLASGKTVPTRDERLPFKFYRPVRRLLGLRLHPPHPFLRKYRLGIYLTKEGKIRYGPLLPNFRCYSLSYKGANMSFKREAVEGVSFVEHPRLRRCLGFEQHFALSLLLRGYDTVYTPENPLFHIRHESLSRTAYKSVLSEIISEQSFMESLLRDLLDQLG
ncbi:MAG: glycosyltransferase [Candidatus Methanosuratincola sp.]